jgi:hypothetical protein
MHVRFMDVKLILSMLPADSAAHTIKYTSHFNLTSAEIDLLVDSLDDVCKNYSA